MCGGGGISHSYDSPLVSIICPIYNVEEYLPMCLDSILNQTYQNIELVCVNDGSPDNCGQIIKKYAAMDERILAITQKNQGLSAARNTGMRYAHGEYTMFVDSDDWIEAETCEAAVGVALKYDADLVMWSYVREYGQDLKEKYMFWKDESIFEKAQVQNQLHRRICGLFGEELRHPDYANALETVWGKLYLTERIVDNHVGFVDTKEIGTEDALFNLYVLGYIERAVYLRRCYNHYRKTNQGSLTKTYNEKLFERWQRLFDYMRQYIQENNLPMEYNEALDNRIALSLLGLGLNIVGSNYGMGKKITLLRDILSNDRYKAAYKELDFSFFPIHWKVFYSFAAHGFTFGVYILLLIIRKFIYG